MEFLWPDTQGNGDIDPKGGDLDLVVVGQLTKD